MAEKGRLTRIEEKLDKIYDMVSESKEEIAVIKEKADTNACRVDGVIAKCDKTTMAQEKRLNAVEKVNSKYIGVWVGVTGVMSVIALTKSIGLW